MARYWFVFITTFLCLPGWGSEPPQFAGLIKTQVGACKYRNNEGNDHPPLVIDLCLNGQTQTDLLYLSKGSTKEQLAHETQVFAGMHLGKRHSLLLSGRYFASHDFEGELNGNHSLSTPYFIYQYGKLYHDPFQVTIGKQTLPFGVERQPLIGFFSLYHPSQFWDGPNLGLNLTISNTQSLFFQVGAFTEGERDENGEKGPLSATPQAYTGRIFLDRPSWQGTKIIISGYRHRSGNDRVGFAIINATSDERVVQIEFIRSYFHHAFWLSEFNQLIRLFFQSARVARGQYYFLYDEVHRQHRFATLGGRYFFNQLTYFQLGVTFDGVIIDENSKTQTQWGGISGIGALL